jgi:hypothetical protein
MSSSAADQKSGILVVGSINADVFIDLGQALSDGL